MGEREDPFVKAREFRDKHGLTYYILVDKDDALNRHFGVEAFPTNAIIDKDGKRVYQEAGFNSSAIVRTLNRLTANTSGK